MKPTTTRRGVLGLGIPALVAGAATTLTPETNCAADELSNSSAMVTWPERRKGIERKWLDLLGEFPTDIPELRIEMKEVARDDGITRYHVSFQSEADDRVTAWLLVPDAARK